LVEAFRQGEDAATAFANTVSKTLENALQQLIFSKVFSSLFDGLENDLTSGLLGYGLGGGLGGIYEAFSKFMQGSEEALKIWEEIMRVAQEEGKRRGFNLWEPEEEDERAKGLSGAVK